MRTVERLFRRAEVPVCESEGFRPKPRFHYPTSLALGMGGIDEVLEADLADAIEPAELLDRLNAQTVPGLEFTHIEVLPTQSKKGQPRRVRFEVQFSEELASSLQPKLAEFQASTVWNIARENKHVDIRPLVEELSMVGGVLSMTLTVVNDAGARPRDVLEALGFSPDETLELEITRTQVEMAT